jgi:hypothetical protein
LPTVLTCQLTDTTSLLADAQAKPKGKGGKGGKGGKMFKPPAGIGKDGEKPPECKNQ